MTTRCALSLFALTSCAGLALGQSCPTSTKLDRGASAEPFGNFAAAVSMSFGGLSNAPLLAVGEPNQDAPVAGVDAGGFTVFHKPFGSWVQMYSSWNSTGTAGEHLGKAIALADPFLIAGAPGYSNTGRARIYRRPPNGSGYTGPVDVYPSLNGAGTDFGTAVAVSNYGGGWAVVGAPKHDFHGESDAGAVFFYTFDAANYAWPQTYQIWGGDFSGRSGDHRGTAVAMSQSTQYAAVGSPDRELTGQPADHGTVRVVHRLPNGFVSGTSVELAPPSPEAGERFGAAVAIEGTLLVVGAPDEDMTMIEGGFVQAATDGGAIYIFTLSGNTWTFTSKLRAPLPTAGSHFGASVATDGTQIVVGEPGTKKAYVLANDGGAWRYQAVLGDTDFVNNGTYANAVAVRSGTIAAADMLDDNNGVINSGAVYATAINPSTFSGDLCGPSALDIPAGDYVGCTDIATPSSNIVTSCGGSAQGPDVWFRFQPDCNGNAIFDTFGSTFDTVLSVHTGCPGALSTSTLICNDDAGFAPPNNDISLVTFNFTAGQTYYIRVAGTTGESGLFTLRHLYAYQQPNDECSTATPLGNVFGTWDVTTCAATNSPGPITCGSGVSHHDVWYQWIAPTSGPVHINTCGSDFDTILAVYVDSQINCTTNPLIACNDDSVGACSPSGISYQSSVTFNTVAGQPYMIRVGGFSNQDFGLGSLNIVPVPVCNDIDFNNDGLLPDTADLDDLVSVFSGGPCSTGNCDSIDFNNDGLVPDVLDIDSFLSVIAGGPCL